MTWTWIRRLVGGFAAGAALSIVALELALLAFRPEEGFFGVLQVLTPHLAILGVALGLLAVALRSRPGTVATVGLAVLTIARFGGDWFSFPVTAAAGSRPLTVASWNLELTARPAADTVRMLRDVSADVVALQELTPGTAAAIQADPVLAERYPSMALRPRDDVFGMGVLSSAPIVDSAVELGPAIQTVHIRAGSGTVTVLNVHPMHADIESVARRRVPIGIDVDRRNADLVVIRGRVDEAQASGGPVITLGDFNTASSEPAFDRLTEGLRDVHAEVGQGTGWTWRPIRLEFLGIGLIRIDHILVTPDVTPVAIEERCPAIGDHCLVHAEVALP